MGVADQHRPGAEQEIHIFIAADIPDPSATAVTQQAAFDYYRQNIEPLFLRPRGYPGSTSGNPACIMCHVWQTSVRFSLEEPMDTPDGGAWTEEQSRRSGPDWKKVIQRRKIDKIKKSKAENLLKNAQAKEESGDLLSAKQLLYKVNDCNPETPVSVKATVGIERIEQQLSQKKESESPGLIVAVAILIAAGKFGMFDGASTGAELGFLLGTLSGLIVGTTVMWKSFGKVVGIITLVAAVSVLFNMQY